MATIKENLTVEACPGCGALDATRRCLGCRHDFRYLTVEAGEPLRITHKLPEVAFLAEAARYFETRPTGGEDAAHWSNVFNAKNCRKAADTLERQADEINRLRLALVEAGMRIETCPGAYKSHVEIIVQKIRAALTGEDTATLGLSGKTQTRGDACTS